MASWPFDLWNTLQILAPLVLYALWKLAKSRSRRIKKEREAAHEAFEQYKKNLEDQYAHVPDKPPLTDEKPPKTEEEKSKGKTIRKDDDDFISYDF